MLLYEVLHGAALRRPDHIGLTCAGKGYTYAELSDRVHRVAGSLCAMTEPGDRVAILADNSVEYIDLLYAPSEAGCTLAQVNQRLAAPEVEYVLSNVEPAVLIVSANYQPLVAGIQERVPSIKHLVVIGENYDRLLEAAPADGSRRHRTDDEVAWIIHTSGTTGRPKGAMLTHRSMLAAMLNCMIEWKPTPDDRNLFCFPLCHVAAFIPILYHLRCATLVLMPGFEPGGWLSLVEEHQITHTGLAPVMLNFLLQHPAIETTDVSSVSLVVYGAAPMPPALLERGIAKFGDGFIGSFGMTELSGNVLQLDIEHHRRAVNGEPGLLLAAGRMECLADVRLVDDDLNDVPLGEVGEIIVKGDQVMKGYWRDPEATAQALVDGWMRSGDLARKDAEGLFYIVDRKKDMVLTGGENVYPKEVEDVLSWLPGLSEVAVIGLPDGTWGEVVTAVVVAKPGETVTAEAVQEHCRSQLAGYKVPKRVEFIDVLPRNAAGKLLKRVLREQFS